jgi:hypothetical protein
MKLPKAFYGTSAQAVPRIRKLARALLTTREFSSYDAGTFLEMSEVEGHVLVDKPYFAAENHFHCYALSQEISNVSAQSEIAENIHEWLIASLDTEWRFLCTLGGSSRLGLVGFPPIFARRYVEAAVRHWPAIAPYKTRFGPTAEGRTILNCWWTLFIALEILGLSAPEQMAKPGREPRELLDVVEQRGTGRG